MTSVAEALRKIKKLCAIESEGARLIYFRHCIETALEEEREACALLVSEELARWNCGGRLPSRRKRTDGYRMLCFEAGVKYERARI